jgi:hypothetical protein
MGRMGVTVAMGRMGVAVAMGRMGVAVAMGRMGVAVAMRSVYVAVFCRAGAWIGVRGAGGLVLGVRIGRSGVRIGGSGGIARRVRGRCVVRASCSRRLRRLAGIRLAAPGTRRIRLRCIATGADDGFGHRSVRARLGHRMRAFRHRRGRSDPAITAGGLASALNRGLGFDAIGRRRAACPPLLPVRGCIAVTRVVVGRLRCLGLRPRSRDWFDQRSFSDRHASGGISLVLAARCICATGLPRQHQAKLANRKCSDKSASETLRVAPQFLAGGSRKRTACVDNYCVRRGPLLRRSEVAVQREPGFPEELRIAVRYAH